MIIEFIGVPGAGKTTMTPTVIEYLQKKGMTALTVVEAARPFAQRTLVGKLIFALAPAKLKDPLLWQVFYRLSTFYRLKFFAKNPRLIWFVLKSQYQRPIAADHRRRVLNGFFHTVGYYAFLTSYLRPDEALIFDEGFTHRVVQTNASDSETPNKNQILTYIDLIPHPDLLIFVDAPWEICEDRMYSRGLWKQFNTKNRAQVSQFVKNAHTVVHTATDHIQAKNWPVIEVNNGSDTPAQGQTTLLNKLQSLATVN